MKHIAFVLFAALATACAHNPQPQSQAVNTHSAEWQPPTDFEWSWQDQGKHRAPSTPEPTQSVDQEQQRYQDSVARINAQIADEKLQLRFAEETYGKPSTYYRNLQHKFCEVDMLLDTRGTHHPKDYCSQTVSRSPAIPKGVLNK